MNKKKPGQPTKYREEYCLQIIEHVAQGYSFESFAGKVGVCVDTLLEWAKVHPEFSVAKKLALPRGMLFWEALGIKGVQGQIPNFNLGAWVFNMKNRFKWRDRFELQETRDITITIKEEEKKLALQTARDILTIVKPNASSNSRTA